MYVRRIDLGSMIEEKVGYFGGALLSRKVQRREPVVISAVRIVTGGQPCFCGRNVVL